MHGSLQLAQTCQPPDIANSQFKCPCKFDDSPLIQAIFSSWMRFAYVVLHPNWLLLSQL